MRKIRRFFQDNNIVKFIWKIIKFVVEFMFILVALTIIIQRITNNEQGFFGYRIFCVITGSMEPQYTVGDIIVSKEKKPEELKVGDTLVYIGKENEYSGKIITHKIVKIEQDENGKYRFHTKGIANTVEDPIVEEDQSYGIVISSVQLLTFIYRIMANKYSLYFIVILPITIAIFIGWIRSKDKEMKRAKEDEEIRRLGLEEQTEEKDEPDDEKKKKDESDGEKEKKNEAEGSDNEKEKKKEPESVERKGEKTDVVVEEKKESDASVKDEKQKSKSSNKSVKKTKKNNK